MTPLDIGLHDAFAAAAVPAASRTTKKTSPEFYLDVVVKSGLDVSIADAITGGEVERTMEGASTLTLTLFDPHRALLRNPDLSRAIDMTWGGYWWRLVKLSKSGDNLTLTFEDRDVAYLRAHKKARKAYRDTVTRAQFIRQLVREVGQRNAKSKKKAPRTGPKAITFVCPELNVIQPIGDDGSGGGDTAGKKTNVLYVGDSLAVGTIPELRKQIPKTPLAGDGQVGRTSSQALSVLNAKLKPAHTTVVFDAGTNDDPTKPSDYRDNLNAVKTAIGTRRLVVATLNRGNADVAAMNAEVRAFGKASGATVVDWGKMGDKYLGGDGTHPTAKGYTYRAKLMASAIGRGQSKAKAPAKRTEAKRDDAKLPGLNAKASVSVKGARASAEQIRNGEAVLDVADELGAGPKATKALMEAVIVESGVKNLSGGDRDSIGILQIRVGIHGRDVAGSIEKACHAFLTQGFTGRGGAMKLARENSGMTAGQVAQACQGSAYPTRYDERADEAQGWIDAYGGASGSDTGGTAVRGSSRSKKKYEFRRGEPGKAEDSWTAIQRLATEVAWHAFMDRGKLYYVSDDWLLRQRPAFIVDEDDDGIQEINFDIDSGKVSADVTVTARAEAFEVPAGSVMELTNCGIADGRYIVTKVHQSIYDYACDITLRAPTPALPEPEAEASPVGRGAQGDTSASVTGGSLRDKIVAVARASAASYKKNPGAWFYSQGGASIYQDPTKPPKRGTRSDCSQWVCCVYKKAGAPPPGSAEIGATGTMRGKGHAVPLSQAKPGDIILYGAPPSHHVELYVGPGQATIGHGSAPVDAGTIGMQPDPHCWRYDFLD